MTSLFGAMNKCRVLTLTLLYTKLRHTWALDPFGRRLRPVHPRQVANIKLEVEKILKASFIYPVALLMGYPISFQLIRNKVRSTSASIIGI
jgi:hypothetical protein